MSLFGDGLELLKLVDKGHNAPLYSQLGEWIDKVAALQQEIEALTAENAALREEIRFKGTLVRVDGHTFINGDDEEICPRCAEANSKAIHLISQHSQRPPYQKAACPECKVEFLHNRPARR
jgi:phage FluMu protein Com